MSAANTPRPIIPVTGKIGAAITAFETGKRLRDEAHGLWSRNFAYTVSVSEDDPLYSDIHAWLLDLMPDEKNRSLLVASSRNRGEGSSDSNEKASPLVVRFDDRASRKVRISGYPVTVRLNRPSEDAGKSDDFMHYGKEPKKIEFVTTSHSAQRAVVSELERINAERSKSRKAALWMVASWGSWMTRNDIPPRTLDSVTIPTDQKNRIVNDISEFIESEAAYNRLAIPWHRSYMFHGPPGTGKTSIVKALANHFNLDLWYVGLSDLKTESSLMSLIGEVRPGSILLLEDIDTIKITHDRDSSEQGTISMSALLNALDGVATPHGLITMMTTNRFDILDEALVRAGRMDLIEEFGYPSRKDLADMYRYFFDKNPSWALDDEKPIEGLSTARVAEIFKQNFKDPEAADIAVWSLL